MLPINKPAPAKIVVNSIPFKFPEAITINSAGIGGTITCKIIVAKSVNKINICILIYRFEKRYIKIT